LNKRDDHLPIGVIDTQVIVEREETHCTNKKPDEKVEKRHLGIVRAVEGYMREWESNFQEIDFYG
jgi:hypothetical protein